MSFWRRAIPRATARIMIPSISSQVIPPNDGRERKLPQPGNDALLEECRKAAALLGPRDSYLLDAVQVTVDPRNVCGDKKLVLAEIQMAPAPRARIVLRCSSATNRAGRWTLMRDRDFDLLLADVQDRIAYHPWRGDA